MGKVTVMTDARYDSRYESKYKYELQEVVEYILDHKYGDTIAFEKLANILKFNIEDETEKKKFKNQMARVKNFLIEYGYILKSIAGVGYYILKPQHISGFCYHTYIRRTLNLLEKSDRILQHVDTWEMSNIRKQEHEEMQELNKGTIEAINREDKNSNYKKHKTQYDAIID